MILVALHQRELADFFPGELGTALRELVAERGGAFIDPADWPAPLTRLRPQILVSAWAARQLPADAGAYLRYVCQVTGGVRHVVPRELVAQGLRVSNWGDCAAEPVAESTLMLILAGLRRTQHWGRELHERQGWRHDGGGGRTLFDRPVAIHGFGRIARTLIGLLKPFRTPVSVFSQGVPADAIRALGAEPKDSLEALVAGKPDIFVELEALTPQTRGTVQERHLQALPRGTLFVNSGRGAVIDEAALERIAVAGHLRLALDVFAVEPPPPTSPFRGLPDVTLMPHQGGPTPDLYPSCGRQALANLRRFLAGEPLTAVIDLRAYDLST
jgi:phosphoglycerate dehydrogenase-like enzyme